MRLADTIAAELAQQAWLGVDAPGDPHGVEGVRVAIERGLPGDFTFEDVLEWSHPLVRSIVDTIRRDDALAFEGRIVGAVAAALILGVRLAETSGT